MIEFYFDFYGVILGLSAGAGMAQAVLRNLKEDFWYFLCSREPGPTDLRVELRAENAPPTPIMVGPKLFKTRMCSVRGLGSRRVCDYGFGSQVIAVKGKGRRFRVFSTHEGDLYEIAYTVILSAVGEALDRRNFHRVHALGAASGDEGLLMILPQGGGKSALALQLLQKKSALIFSDESPLVHRGKLYPYPLRLALAPEAAKGLNIPSDGARLFCRRKFPSKLLFPLDQNDVPRPRNVTKILAGVPSETEAVIRPCRRSRVLEALAKSLVVGWGVAQMAEYMIRADSIPVLPKIGFSRLEAAIGLTRQAAPYEFLFTRDARENARVLENFLSTLN